MKIPDELRVLYPQLSDEQLMAAKENFDRYILLAWGIMKDQLGGDDSIDGGDDEPYDSDKGRFPTNINSVET